MEHEILEHRKRLDILRKHLKSNYYNVGQYHQAISDAMKEYAEQPIVNGVSTSQDQALNLAGVSVIVCPNCGSDYVIYVPKLNPKPKCLDCDFVWAYER